MRKVIIITDDTKYSQLSRYDDYPLLVLSKNFSDIKSSDIFYDYFKTSYIPSVDPSTLEERKEEEHDVEYAIKYLYKKGFDEITILSNIKTSSDNYLYNLLLMKKYKHLKIVFETEEESIQYFEEGTHIITKGNSNFISICPFLEAMISLDYTVEKMTHIKLDSSTGLLKNIKLFQRIALLKVEKGSVLVIRKLGDKDEN